MNAYLCYSVLFYRRGTTNLGYFATGALMSIAIYTARGILFAYNVKVSA